MRSERKLSGRPVNGAVSDRLLRFAGAALAAGLALSFSIGVLARLLPELIGSAVVVGVVVLTIAAVRYRRSHW